ncbi:bifunctional Ankyrin repeat/Bromodomain-like superfamily/Bromodomain/Ankyrin repeat-containing domain superfamily/Bromodomain [Babesia duncani]|uniref:Bifunctional Ankyrin repeat/Bromodomain-like superfamily/Bromodomain/Ankyrin repeat-containing domain superfamily/Bromodomain n=1 Tax=Babesia duncani TaxID=323732 RepID=A0AAD9UNF6_9APIC|nr:bifunctional Ankyrin repeat/Bromodomain-like superfamily/Bromodomain/Ankyrin repeat-containing domain superfamily/Bromodomain [Babesia duncani]
MATFHESYLNNPVVRILATASIDEIRDVLEQEYAECKRSRYDADESIQEIAKKKAETLIEPNMQITPLCQLSVRTPEDALEISKLLVEEYKLCDPGKVDLIGQTCLFYAARDGRSKLCEYLAQNGCAINHADRLGQTCLFYASREGHAETLETLIECGADVNITDTNRQTCLFYAARDGRLEAVKLLLKHKINAGWKDAQRRTAYSFAKTKGHSEIADLLKNASSEHKPIPKRSLPQMQDRSDAPITNTQSGVPMVTQGQNAQRTKRYRLQYRLPDDKGVWMDAPLVKVKEFEIRFPHLATWDKSAPFAPANTLRNPTIMQWHSVALNLLATLYKQEGGYVFERPVDPKRQNCPDYYDVIKRPISFSCIKSKVKRNQYESPKEFIDDVQLVFDNCFQYNKPETWVAGVGRNIEAIFKQQLTQVGFEDFCAKHDTIQAILMEAQEFINSHEKNAATN